MALLVERSYPIMGGLITPQLYIRFDYYVNVGGKNIMVNVRNYVSREAYDGGSDQNIISIPLFKDTVGYEYDRVVDGSDVLTFVHNKYKEYLSTDITEVVAQRDPSTGEKLYDPSTGELLTETIIQIPKFAMDSSISIVDMGDE